MITRDENGRKTTPAGLIPPDWRRAVGSKGVQPGDARACKGSTSGHSEGEQVNVTARGHHRGVFGLFFPFFLGRQQNLASRSRGAPLGLGVPAVLAAP